MSEKELRQKVITKAKSWLWRKESDGSFREIIDTYNAIKPLPGGYRMSYSDPWCAAFISAVGWACGLSSVILPECSCERMISLYRAVGRWQERDDYPAQPGDLVMYDWGDSGAGDCTGEADHVGLIVEVRDGTFVVAEGNMSDAVGTRILSRNGRYIRGFCCPDYSLEAEPGNDEPETPAQDEEKEADVVAFNMPLRTLSAGDVGEIVRAAQILLIGRGWRCGPWGADGEFGPNTEDTVRRYQRSKGLTIDGVIGPETWRSLLGVM